MKNTAPQTFLYRVEVEDTKGARTRHLAEVSGVDCDENARRKIIHTTLAIGGRVISICETEDHTRYPGEAKKQRYDK